ncbi:unnamed protein product, partial [Brassica napus]
MPCLLEETQYIFPAGSPTLVELLKDCDSFRKEDSSSVTRSDDTAHHIIDIDALHVPPAVPFVLAFINLAYSVTLRQRFGSSSTTVKTLLDDVSGEACDGDILAVLGASGAGKSTLIDALAGRRRRVSIVIDIIHDPIVLFLDEPTSGLDSTNAFMVVQVLKRIAQSGSIVIMSIHQPSARILDLLDRLIILSRGKSVFNGSPANLPSFFSDFGHPIPERENITEFSLDLVRELEREPNEGTRELVDFNDGWQKKKFARDTTQTASQQALSLKEAIDASVSRGKLVSGSSGSMETISSYANPSLYETFILAKRYMKNWIRMPELVGTRIATVM